MKKVKTRRKSSCQPPISFEESINFETLGISYTASAVLLKNDELHTFEALDGYSGFFPYNHRRRARTLSPKLNFIEDGGLEYDLEGSVITAAKTAACEKLTKQERKNIAPIGPVSSGFLFFVGLFLFMGGTFGLLMCPAMFLLAVIIGAPITAILSEALSFLEYLKLLLFDFPWWQMFLFCVVGFGLPMTILTALSKKRG